MVKSHYVPQLILRHFGTDERIQYCDFDKKSVETRNIKSTFAEKGYYPDNIESELCFKAETDFAYLLNSKILKEKYSISLSPEELFILKKYLIIASIRFNYAECYNSETVYSNYSEDFFNNINKVLACENLEDLYSYIEPQREELANWLQNSQERTGEMKLLSDIKSIVQSYVVFVSTSKCGENLVIPDVGFSYKASHLAIGPYSDGNFDKCMYTLNLAIQTGNQLLMSIVHKLTPYDYIIIPVSKDMAIISFSTFYKFFNKQSEVYGIIPTRRLKVSELLGFGDNDLVEPPRVKNPKGLNKRYEYNIKQLSKNDARFVNGTLFNNAEHYCGFDELSKIIASVEFYNGVEAKYRRHNLEFLMES